MQVKNLEEWILSNKQDLQPPVCNKLLFPANGFITMVVGGPNARKDFHVNQGPELFYQLKGEMLLKVIQDSSLREIPIRAGEVFQLDPLIPHSPQRFTDSVGLVVEQVRRPEDLDALHWYCENCWNLLYQESFPLRDVVTDLPPVFERFAAATEKHTCGECGVRFEV